jgi:FkbM family methyltransferase
MNIINPSPSQIDTFSKVLDSFYLDTSYEKDRYVQDNCKKYAIWEPDLTKWMVENIKPGWICLDMGFNIGYYSELMGRLVGKSGKIFAFEPIVELIDKYNNVKKLNNYSECAEIVVFPYALSDKEEDLIIWLNGENVGGSFIINDSHDLNNLNNTHPDSKGINIKSKTLKNLYDGPIDFIKIDIEGYEPMAWEGFSNAAKNCNLIVAELGSHQPLEFLTKIDSNYNMYNLDETQTTIEQICEIGLVNVVLRRK